MTPLLGENSLLRESNKPREFAQGQALLFDEWRREIIKIGVDSVRDLFSTEPFFFWALGYCCVVFLSSTSLRNVPRAATDLLRWISTTTKAYLRYHFPRKQEIK